MTVFTAFQRSSRVQGLRAKASSAQDSLAKDSLAQISQAKGFTSAILRHSARYSILMLGLLSISACSTMNNIGKTNTLPSVNYNSRVSIIVIHHTSANFKDSVDILTKKSSRPVSSHYLVPDPSDKSYPHKKLKVFELVPESERAWHAGRSYWAGKSGLNDQSIGIEVVNQTYCKTSSVTHNKPPRLCFYPDFAESQMEILIKLLDGILERHPHIKPTNIIGHSDIAPSRKIDPGPRFPWERLYQLGIGAWFDNDTVVKYWEEFTIKPMPIINIQRALGTYGYKIEPTGIVDAQTRNVLRAFQLHFRPLNVNGEPTLESTAILFALIEKYHPNQLNKLLKIGG